MKKTHFQIRISTSDLKSPKCNAASRTGSIHTFSGKRRNFTHRLGDQTEIIYGARLARASLGTGSGTTRDARARSNAATEILQDKKGNIMAWDFRTSNTTDREVATVRILASFNY